MERVTEINVVRDYDGKEMTIRPSKNHRTYVGITKDGTAYVRRTDNNRYLYYTVSPVDHCGRSAHSTKELARKACVGLGLNVRAFDYVVPRKDELDGTEINAKLDARPVAVEADDPILVDQQLCELENAMKDELRKAPGGRARKAIKARYAALAAN